MGVAANSLCQHPHSKVAKDNFEAFCHMWQVLLTDVIQISKQVAEQTNQLHSIALQSSLPRIIKVRKNLVQTLFMKKIFQVFPTTTSCWCCSIPSMSYPLVVCINLCVSEQLLQQILLFKFWKVQDFLTYLFSIWWLQCTFDLQNRRKNNQ